MDTSEAIIDRIREIGQDIANEQGGNYYLIDHLDNTRDELIQDLIKHHGYKDEQAVWDKIDKISEKEWDERMQQEIKNEERKAEYYEQELELEKLEAKALKLQVEKAKQEAESLKQKRIKDPLKNRLKIRIKKGRGFRI